MSHFKLFLRLEAIETLKTTRGLQRRQISTFIDGLGSNPDTTGDYTESDDTDRLIVTFNKKDLKPASEFGIAVVQPSEFLPLIL